MVATRKGSTSDRPAQHRSTARTIFITSTGSVEPLRLVTRMVRWGEISSIGPSRGGISPDVEDAITLRTDSPAMKILLAWSSRTRDAVVATDRKEAAPDRNAQKNTDAFGPTGIPADASSRPQKWRGDGREIGTEEKT
ncbi:protein of unknown function [Candidatus Nitrospira inopinata]|uniref:Uncharacterized protein n=1 Tax=Candidatus Nitrospira inopinata TaxID=1715989 RepID=A0A0S4KLM0_9BACT|nr:protein of unknown function [Candidatus Nitrospira inopinata]